MRDGTGGWVEAPVALRIPMWGYENARWRVDDYELRVTNPHVGL